MRRLTKETIPVDAEILKTTCANFTDGSTTLFEWFNTGPRKIEGARMELLHSKNQIVGVRFCKPSKCSRCGGRGGWEGWPGFTCFQCNGSGRGLPVATEWLAAEVFAEKQIAKAARDAKRAEKEKAREAALMQQRAAHYETLVTRLEARGELLREALLFIREQIDGDTFTGCNVIADCDDIVKSVLFNASASEKQIGAIVNKARAVFAYRAKKEMERERSEYFGVPGARFTTVATLQWCGMVGLQQSYVGYGPEAELWLYRFQSVEGFIFVWLTTSKPKIKNRTEGDEFVAGTNFVLTATVKSHRQRDGVKQTVISRPTFEIARTDK